MSSIAKFETSVVIPNVNDFASSYPHYKNRATTTGKVFFDLVMTPESFLKAACATDDLDLPGVAALAKQCFEAAGGSLSGTDKQYIGALVCALMEANGYRKTGTKRAIPHKAFTKGEVYRKL